MRIAIVNDLALARMVLSRLVESVPGYSVAWMAVDGAEAVRRAAEDRPDAVLMDLIMPVMDGAEATRRIMSTHPCPILVVTASPGANFSRVYDALGAGGIDAVRTPAMDSSGKIIGGDAVLSRLERIAAANAKRSSSSVAIQPPSKQVVVPAKVSGTPFLAIGASTGGPEAVAEVLNPLKPLPAVPIVVVQHISSAFAAGFASWIQSRTGHRSQIAKAGETPLPEHIYVAASEDHLILRPDRKFDYVREPVDYPYRPSVTTFFESLIAGWPAGGVAVLLTGMGSDGARGMAKLKQCGWITIAQDRDSCVVYGMPKAAAEIGAATKILPLAQIGPEVANQLQARLKAR